jgi:transcription antitermination factor NusG
LSDEISSSSSKSWGGARANSGGARVNSGGARENSGGARANSGGARENSGGRRDGAGRPRERSVLAVMSFDIDRWYCVRTKFGEANLADEEVRLAGFTVFNPSLYHPPTPPRRDVRGMMRPAKPERIAQAFPRYFFVRLNLSDPGWHQVRRLPGVERIMSVADHRSGPGIPIALPDGAIESIRALCKENDCIYPLGWKFSDADPERPHVPEPVEIEAGTRFQLVNDPCDSQRTFICDWSDGKNVGFLMEILGREAPTTVAQSSVRIAA